MSDISVSKKNSKRINAIICNIVEELTKYSPNKIILFGSRAGDSFRENSDIDIAVDLKLSFREKRKLKEKIDKLSGIYSVDMVFLPDIDDKFYTKIIETGKVLYEKE
ncbi:nucleotidyltransferase domain-containing protein [Deferribacteraceae bacterium V6Fe1]|nr:nucleotidyltransferase domain-containing protein [Deferribacteraceae bacterium V6Fe1]